jgi:hypothetical protein
MSSGSTSNYSLSYPVPTDPVNVAGDIKNLADNVDAFLTAPAFISNLAINGGSLVTDAVTANLFNTNATTLNIGGAATAVNIGNASGQVNFVGDVNVATGKKYEINNVSVLTSTTLGSSVVSSSLTSVGTIATGIWNATEIAVNKGGTGLTSYSIGDIVYASGATTLSKLADVATGNALISGGVGVVPSWGKIALTTHVSGTLPVSNGGTGITSLGGGVATWLGTPSSANLLSAVTDETGSGSLVFSTSPSLTTPNIGAATASSLLVQSSEPDIVFNQTTSGFTTFTFQDNGTNRFAIGKNSSGNFYLTRYDGSSWVDTAMSLNVLTGQVGFGQSITLGQDTDGSPSSNISMSVERGTDPNVEIRWNELGDAWQFTNDGTTYFDIPTSAGGGAGLEAVLMFAGM